MRPAARRGRGVPGGAALSPARSVVGSCWRGAVSGMVALAASLAGLPAGCAVPHASLTAPFVPAEHERCAGAGRGSLAGRLLVRGEGGEAVPVAGGDVTLWPASAYSRAVAADLAAGGRPRPEGLLAPYARPARTDDRGGFRLDRLPPCRYVVLARVPGSLTRRPPAGRLRGGGGRGRGRRGRERGPGLAARGAVPGGRGCGAARQGGAVPPPSPAPSLARTAAAAPGGPVRALRSRPGAAAAVRVGDRAGAGQVRAAGRARGEPADADGLHPRPGRSRAVRRLRRVGRAARPEVEARPAPAASAPWNTPGSILITPRY